MNIFLYFNEKSEQYIYNGDDFCSHCGREFEMEKPMFFVTDYGKRQSYFAAYCVQCHEGITHRTDLIHSLKLCIRSDNVQGCVPVFLAPPELANKGLSTIEAANPEFLKGIIIDDKTHYAGRIHRLEGFAEQQRLTENRLAELDAPVDDIDTFFEKVKGSQLLIPESKYPLLEVENE